MANSNAMSGSAYYGKYGAELIETAAKITAPGKGILAADESTGTIGKRVRKSFQANLYWVKPDGGRMQT